MNVSHYAAFFVGLLFGWLFNAIAVRFGYDSLYPWLAALLAAIPWYFLVDNASLRKRNFELWSGLWKASAELEIALKTIKELKATIARIEEKTLD
jgi:hypothetical protein